MSLGEVLLLTACISVCVITAAAGLMLAVVARLDRGMERYTDDYREPIKLPEPVFEIADGRVPQAA